jgi:hypothetical protein
VISVILNDLSRQDIENLLKTLVANNCYDKDECKFYPLSQNIRRPDICFPKQLDTLKKFANMFGVEVDLIKYANGLLSTFDGEGKWEGQP